MISLERNNLKLPMFCCSFSQRAAVIMSIALRQLFFRSLLPVSSPQSWNVSTATAWLDRVNRGWAAYAGRSWQWRKVELDKPSLKQWVFSTIRFCTLRTCSGRLHMVRCFIWLLTGKPSCQVSISQIAPDPCSAATHCGKSFVSAIVHVMSLSLPWLSLAVTAVGDCLRRSPATGLHPYCEASGLLLKVVGNYGDRNRLDMVSRGRPW